MKYSEAEIKDVIKLLEKELLTDELTAHVYSIKPEEYQRYVMHSILLSLARQSLGKKATVEKLENIIQKVHKEFKSEIRYGANQFYMSLSKAIYQEIGGE